MRHTILILRLLHGMVVVGGILRTAHYLAAILRDLPRMLERFPSYLFLYSGLMLVQVFIGWTAWRHFGGRSFRRAIVSYCAWLALFVWHGWFTFWAPYMVRINDAFPLPGEAAFPLGLFAIAAFWLCGYAIFPVLCFIEKRRTVSAR
jgi:hypothetical protein